MAPALPKLDVQALQKALQVAKAAGNVDEKLISKAEAKLAQALKRLETTERGPLRTAAEKELKDQMAASPLDLRELKNAIEEAEEQKVNPELTSAAKAKAASAELDEALEKVRRGRRTTSRPASRWPEPHGASCRACRVMSIGRRCRRP